MVVAFQRVESAVVAFAVVVAWVQADFAWWWLLALFLPFDLSMAGYAVSPRWGAWTYNSVHSWLGPAILIGLDVALELEWALFTGLAWAFHVAVDRGLGYGLKFTDRFTHTHLGEIGPQHSAAAS